eukprot:CAMPEP_0172439728 /NCGR_PEP_ID=MMETSP1065-20121228/614_1 /TAXON_ID=265537 /ORGANISM="Amphiprora paludosa, Strain CCMP125" /LENGTH=190 /DNA_ID=CAMNT_0013188449 /DNA_START=80 /DNA_END=652 /DNA_ORIENTATION=+
MTYGAPDYGMAQQSGHYPQQQQSWKAAPPPTLNHGGEIVVVSDGMGPESPLSYQSSYPPADASAEATDVSDPSAFGQQAMVPYDSNQGAVANRPQGIKNPSGLPKEILKMKQNRKRATVGAGVVGGVAGLLVLGPVGAVLGGVGGAVATKQIGKRRERKRLQKISDQEIARQLETAPEVPVHASGATEML